MAQGACVATADILQFRRSGSRPEDAKKKNDDSPPKGLMWLLKDASSEQMALVICMLRATYLKDRSRVWRTFIRELERTLANRMAASKTPS